jgi:hypothetical protein
LKSLSFVFTFGALIAERVTWKGATFRSRPG